jgi:hypothetical protein
MGLGAAVPAWSAGRGLAGGSGGREAQRAIARAPATARSKKTAPKLLNTRLWVDGVIGVSIACQD